MIPSQLRRLPHHLSNRNRPLLTLPLSSSTLRSITSSPRPSSLDLHSPTPTGHSSFFLPPSRPRDRRHPSFLDTESFWQQEIESFDSLQSTVDFEKRETKDEEFKVLVDEDGPVVVPENPPPLPSLKSSENKTMNVEPPPPLPLIPNYNPLGSMNVRSKWLPYHEAAVIFQHPYRPGSWHQRALNTVINALDGETFPLKERSKVQDLTPIQSLKIEKEDRDLGHTAGPLHHGINFRETPPYYSRTINFSTTGENKNDIESIKIALQQYNGIHGLWWHAKTVERLEDTANNPNLFFRNILTEANGGEATLDVFDEMAEEKGITSDQMKEVANMVRTSIQLWKSKSQGRKNSFLTESPNLRKEWQDWWELEDQRNNPNSALISQHKDHLFHMLMAQKFAALKEFKPTDDVEQTKHKGQSIADILNQDEWKSIFLTHKTKSKFVFSASNATRVWRLIFQDYLKYFENGGKLTVSEFYGEKGKEQANRTSLHSRWTSSLRMKVHYPLPQQLNAVLNSHQWVDDATLIDIEHLHNVVISNTGVKSLERWVILWPEQREKLWNQWVESNGGIEMAEEDAVQVSSQDVLSLEDYQDPSRCVFRSRDFQRLQEWFKEAVERLVKKSSQVAGEDEAVALNAKWAEAWVTPQFNTLIPLHVHQKFLVAFWREACNFVTMGQDRMAYKMAGRAWEWWTMLSEHGYKDYGLVLTKEIVALMIKGVLQFEKYQKELVSTYESNPRLLQARIENILDQAISPEEFEPGQLGVALLEYALLAKEIPELGNVEPEEFYEVLKDSQWFSKTEDAQEFQKVLKSWKSQNEDHLRRLEESRQLKERALELELEDRAKEDIQPLIPLNAKDDSAAAHSLATLTNSLSAVLLPDHTMSPYDRQLQLEQDSGAAAERLSRLLESQLKGQNKDDRIFKGLQKYLNTWTKTIGEAITNDLKSLEKIEKIPTRKEMLTLDFENILSADPKMGRIISRLRPTHVAFLAIIEALRMSTTSADEGIKIVPLALKIGEAIEIEFKAKLSGIGRTRNRIQNFIAQHSGKGIKTKLGNSYSDALTYAQQRERAPNTLLSKNVVQKMYSLAKFGAWDPEKKKWIKPEDRQATAAIDSDFMIEWTPDLKVSVGVMLIAYMLRFATLERTMEVNGEIIKEDGQPVFQQCCIHVAGARIGLIKTNPQVLAKLAEGSSAVGLTLQARHLPMLCPPKPWISFNEGGYLDNVSHPIRITQAEQRGDIDMAIGRGQFDTTFKAIDYLGSIPWVVNKKMLAVITHVWNDGKEFLSIPSAEPEKDIPDAPATQEELTDLSLKNKWMHRQRNIIKLRRGAYSERCNINYKLQIAHAFKNEKMYFPHNVDFRGRAYPIPPNLSHIGDDLSRSLLKFYEGKRLGADGLRWLKIHLANKYGKDKVSLADREQWTMDNLENIFKSAENPLENDWWQQADNPWQCLATCFELNSALKSNSAEDFVSHLPVHQDGTCNGLQHYAALGGDLEGAAQVNLSRNEAGKPADVYTGVSNLVNKTIDIHAAAGRREAMILQGRVTRKVVKQTVMTTVYGVTFFGAKQQIEKQLKDIPDIPPEMVSPCAIYLAQQVFLSIGDLFKGASKIQQWLLHTACLIVNSSMSKSLLSAQQLAKEQGRSDVTERKNGVGMTTIKWNSPIGVKVVQPYRKEAKEVHATVLQSVHLIDAGQNFPVDPQPQCAALAPNFIHSLDASHMMFTALKMEEAGLTFASVHDSYWTHAADVSEMGKYLRIAFVEMHSTPILENLRESIIAYAGDHAFKVPESQAKRGRNKDRSQPTQAFETPSETEPNSWRQDLLDVKNDLKSIKDLLPPVPERGPFNLSEVLESEYFFS